MSVLRDLVIIGAGGFGRGVVDVVKCVNAGLPEAQRWRLRGIYDDSLTEENGRRLTDLDVAHLGPVPTERTSAALHYVVGINHPGVRERLADRLDAFGWTAATLIHPDATVETARPIGGGTVVRAGVRVATNTRIGRHVHLNFNVVLGHDVVLEDFVAVNPLASVAGEVRVGARTVVGTGAVVLQGRTLGEDTTVGAAACVTSSSSGGQTLVGIPARRITAA